MLFQFDWTFVVQLINFAIFFAVLDALFLKPVGKAIAARREYLDGLVSGYDAAQAELNALRRKEEEVRASAHRDADLALSKARAEASNEAAAISAGYNERAQAAIAAAQAKANVEAEEARPRNDANAAGLAATIVSRIFSEAGRT